jgi:dephospho-CoA kinase
VIAVGLTGGIACGKSTVARMLRERGVPVLDLDVVAREVVEPGEPAWEEIARRWPTAVVGGRLDRKALGALVVADPEGRRALEAITHPRIRARTEAWLAAQTAPVVFVEAALLVETGSYRRYPRLWVVTASEQTQLSRLRAREGYDEPRARAWLAAQVPAAEKAAKADVVLENDGDEGALAVAVEAAWTRERERALGAAG